MWASRSRTDGLETGPVDPGLRPGETTPPEGAKDPAGSGEGEGEGEGDAGATGAKEQGDEAADVVNDDAVTSLGFTAGERKRFVHPR